MTPDTTPEHDKHQARCPALHLSTPARHSPIHNLLLFIDLSFITNLIKIKDNCRDISSLPKQRLAAAALPGGRGILRCVAWRVATGVATLAAS
jgi:hypothetical protein